MADFKLAAEITLGHEGGLSNDPDDIGKMTYRGISRHFFPGWEGWTIIDRIIAKYPDSLLNLHILTKKINEEGGEELNDLVWEFYKITFWNVHRLDDCNSQKIANELFDSSVNIGNGTVARWLQEDLNALNYDENPKGARWDELTEDGDIGRGTIRVLNEALAYNSKMESRIYKLLDGDQRVYYKNSARKRKTQEKFMGGWLDNRTE